MNDPVRMERLRSFGLSDSASRAYLALLELGLSEARDVSRLAKIPLAKVYQTLDQLQERGLVAVTPTTPRAYEPVAFREFLDRLRERHMAEARELERSADELSALFPSAPRTIPGDRGGVRVVKGRREALHAVRSATTKASKGILLAPAYGWGQRGRHTRLTLETANARGVPLRVLSFPPVKGDGFALTLLDIAEVRMRDDRLGRGDPVSAWFFDDERVVFVHHVPDDDSTTFGKDVGVIIEEEGIVASLRSQFEARWDAASRLKPGGNGDRRRVAVDD